MASSLLGRGGRQGLGLVMTLWSGPSRQSLLFLGTTQTLVCGAEGTWVLLHDDAQDASHLKAEVKEEPFSETRGRARRAAAAHQPDEVTRGSQLGD